MIVGYYIYRGSLPKSNPRSLVCRSPGKELSSLPGLRHTKERGLDLGKEPR